MSWDKTLYAKLKEAGFNEREALKIIGITAVINQQAYQQGSHKFQTLLHAVKKVVEEGVHQTEGPYNNKSLNLCKHERPGYEGCADCIDEYLQKVIKEVEEL